MNTQQKVIAGLGAAAVAIGLIALYRRLRSGEHEDDDEEEGTQVNSKGPEAAEKARSLKDEGNEAFKQRNYDEAIRLYTEALEYTDVDTHLYYSNRSAAYLANGDLAEAVADAQKCIELKPKWSKGYFRLGKALREKGDAEEAFRVFLRGLKLDEESEELKTQLEHTKGQLEPSIFDTTTQLERYIQSKSFLERSEQLCTSKLATSFADLKAVVEQAIADNNFDNLLNESVISNAKDTDELNTLLAVIYILLSDLKGTGAPTADEYARQAHLLAPTNPQVLVLLVHTAIEKERFVKKPITPTEMYNLLKYARDALKIDAQDPLIAHTLSFLITRMAIGNQSLEVKSVLDDLLVAFRNPAANHLLVADAGVRLWFKLFEDPEIGQKLQQDNLSQPPDDSQIVRSLINGGFHDLMFVDFFQESLSEVTFNNPAIEAFLAPVVRKALVTLKVGQDFDRLKRLIHSIGLQCYRNSFSWPYTTEEKRKVNSLVEETKKLLASNEIVAADGVMDKHLYHHLSLIALYRSLAEFEGLADVVKQVNKEKLDPWFVEILKKSIEDPIAEGNLVHSIKTITPISDATEGKRRLYIWDNAGMSEGRLTKLTVKEELQTLYRFQPHGFDGPSSTKVLIAGCGSGQEVYQTAVTYKNVDVYAVDPTIDNLTYALRQNTELGVHPHLYVADITKLDVSAFPQPFDLISANCTLSLVSDPMAAITRIAGLLRPGGIAKLQVYSHRYVDNVRIVREFLRTRLPQGSTIFERRSTSSDGLPGVLRKPTDEEARKARELLFSTDDERIQNAILMSPAFYSLAEFVDLVFHEHVVSFTFHDVGQLLEHAGLNLVAFDFPQIQPDKVLQYQEETDDMNLKDITKLTEFEQQDPEAFQNLFSTISFIAEKPASS